MAKLPKKAGIFILIASVFLSPLAFSYTMYGPVKRGDSLWRIALEHRSSRHESVQKIIQAIKALNPSAFVGEDSQMLRVGSMLKIPSSPQEVREALQEDQNSQAPEKSVAPAVVSPVSSANQPKVSSALPESKNVSPSTLNEVSISPAASAASSGNSLPNPSTLAVSSNTSAPLVSTDKTAVMSPAPASSGFSPWAWIWFFILLGVLGFGWKNRRHWVAHFQGGKELAARRLGLHRVDHEQVFETDTLWKNKSPEYGASHPFREGDAMAQAMIQMAEGDCFQAQKTLQDAIAREPLDIGLRMKFLEVCVSLNDQAGFKEQSDYLIAHLIDETDPRWGKIKNMYLRKWAYDAA